MEFHIWTSLLSSLFPIAQVEITRCFQGFLLAMQLNFVDQAISFEIFHLASGIAKWAGVQTCLKSYDITFPDTEIANRSVGARRRHCDVEEGEQRQVDIEKSKVYHME
jgi:hypothetical protein